MKKLFFGVLIIVVSLICFAESNRKFFDIVLSKGDLDKEFYIAYSWDYNNPVKIEYDYLDRFVRRFELEKANGYFIEIKDSKDNFWFSYKFDVNNINIKLEKNLSMQNVNIEAYWADLPKSQELFLFYEGNLIPLKLLGGRFYLDIDFPVYKKMNLYFKDSADYIFGPVKYYGEKAYSRKIEVKLF
ncbi:MAG: hypothetical protein M0R46_03750 [Candidatus Muirbacterium halophilum]|nr:hypothetical protein [Candidatus Muirbacterium halophilum]MCK9475005.1 hypothetical protein [Candidatus Muirbacterium halophilum]